MDIQLGRNEPCAIKALLAEKWGVVKSKTAASRCTMALKQKRPSKDREKRFHVFGVRKCPLEFELFTHTLNGSPARRLGAKFVLDCLRDFPAREE